MDSKADILGNIEELEKFMRGCGLDSSDVRKYVKRMLTVGPQCDAVPNAHGRFGYDKSNPIPVSLPGGEAEYLRNLRCKCGERFEFTRIGNFGPGPDGHVVDGFELVCKNGKHRIKMFFDRYHAGPSTFTPKGLRTIDGQEGRLMRWLSILKRGNK